MSAARPCRTIDEFVGQAQAQVAGERGERRIDGQRGLTEGSAIEVRQAHQLVAVRIRRGGARTRGTRPTAAKVAMAAIAKATRRRGRVEARGPRTAWVSVGSAAITTMLRKSQRNANRPCVRISRTKGLCGRAPARAWRPGSSAQQVGRPGGDERDPQEQEVDRDAQRRARGGSRSRAARGTRSIRGRRRRPRTRPEGSRGSRAPPRRIPPALPRPARGRSSARFRRTRRGAAGATTDPGRRATEASQASPPGAARRSRRGSRRGRRGTRRRGGGRASAPTGRRRARRAGRPAPRPTRAPAPAPRGPGDRRRARWGHRRGSSPARSCR